MDWERDNNTGGLLIKNPTPESLAARDEELAWCMRNRRPWRLFNGQLLGGRREAIAEDLRQAMAIGRGEWKSRMRALVEAGIPVAAEGTYGALGAYPLSAALSAVTPSTTAETQLLTAAQGAVYLPVPANGVLAPQAYRFVVCGISTTSSTASNYTWTVRAGNSATPASNVSLGASAAIAKTISLTNCFWAVKGDMTIQSVGAPGANSKMLAQFWAWFNSAVGGAVTEWHWGTGSTAASIDTTVGPNSSANGGQFGVDITSSVTVTDTLTIQQIHYMDWN